MSLLKRAGQWVTGRGAARKQPPWGDGFVDEGAEAALAAVAWRDVTSDELVFRLPGLPSRRPLPPDAAERLQPLLAEALARRRSGLPADDPVAAAHAVSCLERGLALLAGAPLRAGPGPDLFEAVCLSWEAALNASYLQPETELLHETLTTAAWLGVLARGRDALLPPGIAEVIQRLLAGPSAAEADPFSLASAYLRFRIEQAGLERTLRRAATDARTHSVVPLVRAAPRAWRVMAIPVAVRAAMQRGVDDARTKAASTLSRDTA